MNDSLIKLHESYHDSNIQVDFAQVLCTKVLRFNCNVLSRKKALMHSRKGRGGLYTTCPPTPSNRYGMEGAADVYAKQDPESYANKHVRHNSILRKLVAALCDGRQVAHPATVAEVQIWQKQFYQ